MAALAGGGQCAYFVQNFSTLGNLAKYRIAPSLHIFAAVVEKIVVLHIDKELSGRRVGVGSAGHGDRAEIIFQAVVSFVLDGLAIGFLFHVSVETAALNHEVVYNPVKDSAIVETVSSVFEEIGNSFRRLFSVQL